MDMFVSPAAAGTFSIEIRIESPPLQMTAEFMTINEEKNSSTRLKLSVNRG